MPVILALVPRGAAALLVVTGLAAAGIVVLRPPPRLAALVHPALLLLALVLWGALSALWSIDAERSLVLAVRLLGVFAAGLALAAAATRLDRPDRLLPLLLVGSAAGLAVMALDLASHGRLNRLVHSRPYQPTELNQLAVMVAILAMPAAAALWKRSRPAALAVFVIGIATVALFVDVTAKFGLLVGIVAAVLVIWRRAAMVRAFAALSLVAVVVAPVALPRLAPIPGIFWPVDHFKESAGHRLLIWWFTGDRIAEHPVVGWGLDASRSIPGGKDEFRPGEAHLPLHPHNAALQAWLELGAPGAALMAVFLALLWRRLADPDWPRLYVAAAAGSLAAAIGIAFAAYGIWQEWWLATLALSAFMVLALGREATPPPP